MFILIVIICVTVLDQASKYMVCSSLGPNDSIRVIPGLFNIIHVRNTGAAWGAFHGFNGPLIIFSAAMLLILVVFRKSLLGGVPGRRLALALIIAGIIGNLLDRLRLGSVVDFLDFYWRTHHFATFNVADSSICIGVAVYIISACFVNDGASAGSPGPGSGVGTCVGEPGRQHGEPRVT